MKQAALTLIGSPRLAAELAAEHTAFTYIAQVPEAEIAGKLCLWRGSEAERACTANLGWMGSKEWAPGNTISVYGNRLPTCSFLREVWGISNE